MNKKIIIFVEKYNGFMKIYIDNVIKLGLVYKLNYMSRCNNKSIFGF
jgi:hypothetical protein